MPKRITRLEQVYEASPWEEGDTPIVPRFRWAMPNGKTMVIYDCIYGKFDWKCICNIIENESDVLTPYSETRAKHRVLFKTTRLWKIFLLSNKKLELVDEENKSKIIDFTPKEN
jgi:hypothetical protein